MSSDFQSQLRKLETILLKSPALRAVLEKMPDFGLPNWYVGAGCIAQTVWNDISNRDLLADINDIDIAYFDRLDLSSETEAHRSDTIQTLLEIPISLDVRNQARVHLWYENRFGYRIEAYESVEKAINTWPTTATAIAVKYDNNGCFTAYAPYGLRDLFAMIVRPNKVQITEEIYLAKANRWKACWPDLTIIPWDCIQDR